MNNKLNAILFAVLIFPIMFAVFLARLECQLNEKLDQQQKTLNEIHVMDCKAVDLKWRKAVSLPEVNDEN